METNQAYLMSLKDFYVWNTHMNVEYWLIAIFQINLISRTLFSLELEHKVWDYKYRKIPNR